MPNTSVHILRYINTIDILCILNECILIKYVQFNFLVSSQSNYQNVTSILKSIIYLNWSWANV